MTTALGLDSTRRECDSEVAMNQDELLERLWTNVIDAVDAIAPLDTKHETAWLDVLHVARSARYDAVFAWCHAFDEEGLSVAEWLALEDDDPRWKGLVARSAATKPPRAPSTDAPFADAVHAELRLRAAKVTPAQLSTLMMREGRAALLGVRALLASERFEPGELAGLHESVLSADPSGREARPGSWPREAKSGRETRQKARAEGPLLELAKSHALALRPDGLRVVAAKDGVVTDVTSRAKVATCKLLANTSSVAWSPDGRWIAAASTSGQIALCDAESGARRHVLEREREGPTPAFSADGATLYGADWSGVVWAWDIATGRVLARQPLGDVMARRVEVALGGDLLVLVSHRPTPTELVRLSPALVVTARIALTERTEDFVVDASAGDRGLACGRDWVAEIDLVSGTLGQRQALAARHVALSPDGRCCVLTTAEGFCVAAPSDVAQRVMLTREHASGRAAFSSDSKRVAIATWGRGEVWDVASLTARPL